MQLLYFCTYNNEKKITKMTEHKDGKIIRHFGSLNFILDILK